MSASSVMIIMAVCYSVADSGWLIGCTRCWWRGHSHYQHEAKARHAAAQHLWDHRHRPHEPRECPHPEKRHHLTEDQARKQIISLYARGRGNPDYRPYLCACGWWKVGHDRKALKKRIRRAVRR